MPDKDFSKEAIMNRAQINFLEQLPAVISELDIDLSRFGEYIWAVRTANKQAVTQEFSARLPGTEHKRIESMVKLFEHMNFDSVFSTNFAWRGIIMDTDGGPFPKLVISLTHFDESRPYGIKIIGDPEMCANISDTLKAKFINEKIKFLSIVRGLDETGALDINNTILTKNDKERFGHDEFYPFIKGGINKLMEDFREANENVIIFIGTWGTGKSTLLRTIMHKGEFMRHGICNSEDALKSPGIIGWIDGFGDDSIVCFEDSDRFLSKRAEGNSQMSAILNMAEGVIQTKRKLMFSTNLPTVNNIDEALVRHGRTFRVIEFRKLTLVEANKARAAIGLDELEDVSPDRVFTLAEALNFDGSIEIPVSPKPVFGFSNG